MSGSGVFIRVDNNTFTTHFQHDGGIYIKPGFKSRLAVEREFKFNLPQPYSNCLINNNAIAYNKGDSNLFDLILNSAYQYTQPTCFLQCVQREIINKCNCTDASVLSLFSNVSKCLHETQIECMSHLYATRLYTNEFVQENCLNACPHECNRTIYKTSLSFIEIVPQTALDYLESNEHLASDFVTHAVDLDASRKCFVYLNVFYESLSYTVSTETPLMDFSALLASIGGNLGLFLGVSVFTLFEIVQLFIEIILKKGSV